MQSAQSLLARGVENLFSNRGSLLVFGLTGRTGSGCSTAADLLGKQTDDLNDYLNPPAHKPLSREGLKFQILRKYFDLHWTPFIRLQASSFITSFLLDCEWISLKDVLSRKFCVPSVDLHRLEQEIFTDDHRHTNATAKLASPPEVGSYEAYWTKTIIALTSLVKRILGTSYTPAYQWFGDNLRRSGNPLSSTNDPDHFFRMPELLAQVADGIHKVRLSNGKRRTCISIDALRSPFEILYLRNHLPGFISVAVMAPDTDRRQRLSKALNDGQIKSLDSKEYPEKNNVVAGYDAFVSQNIQGCLERSDVFINNPGTPESGKLLSLSELARQLVKYAVLSIHPGLVTPTREERCMQIAYAAKSNSGCISRQVGAVVTDEYFAVKSIGWNDVPQGQVPCSLRSVSALTSRKASSSDQDETYSEFEQTNEEFFNHLSRRKEQSGPLAGMGLPDPYCFKDEYNDLKDIKNQVFTRSLHAEENAFLQISKYGGQGLLNGVLFTTASPCELCSKKAFQLGIKHIYYVDPYPGISNEHILRSGGAKFRPEMHLFSGAVGASYHRFYDPLLPLKDELAARFPAPPSQVAVKRLEFTRSATAVNKDLLGPDSPIQGELGIGK
jgi:deoxycytidylate deaminase